MSDPIRSISQNNFILADQKEVSHDNTLKGNGTTENPLGINDNKWYDVRNDCSYNTALVNAGGWNIYYNPFLQLAMITCDVQTTSSTGAQFTWPSYFKAINNFSLGVGLGFYVTPTAFNKTTSTSQWIGGCWTFAVEGTSVPSSN